MSEAQGSETFGDSLKRGTKIFSYSQLTGRLPHLLAQDRTYREGGREEAAAAVGTPETRDYQTAHLSR